MLATAGLTVTPASTIGGVAIATDIDTGLRLGPGQDGAMNARFFGRTEGCFVDPGAPGSPAATYA